MATFTFTAPAGVFNGSVTLPTGVVQVVNGQATIDDYHWYTAIAAGFTPPAGAKPTRVPMKGTPNFDPTGAGPLISCGWLPSTDKEGRSLWLVPVASLTLAKQGYGFEQLYPL